jgi:glycosyltransferase involved in cell wall biosynthesis
MDTQSSIGEKPAQPLISIIVPVYNVEDFLAECLDSLVNQTLQNIEIVAINDGSTDGSNEILEAYSANYPHLIRVFQRANAGLSAARNFGIDVSTGEYIAFVDSDDWVDLHMFDDMYRRAAETESDIVVCAIAQHAENDDRFRDSRVLHQRWSLADYGQSIAENPSLLLASKSYACNKMFHRSLFAENKHRFPVGQWFEDSATIYPLMYDARRISYVAKRLYNWRYCRKLWIGFDQAALFRPC